jgi:adenylylsulfate kinase-like enzyme/2-polyprenyl-3-methyl-5-hydroxy-6-metoxy-1,4-benzoquinol methylase
MVQLGSARSGVVWITGHSAAGKTTVARKVVALLRQRGVNPVFLDGDDLRGIFGNHWGYEREQRVELAKIYFRLCSHLASQGLTVVISAVAMYDEVRTWLRANVPGSIEVFLDVPADVRIDRDGRTKGIYQQLGKAEGMYDLPKSADLVIANHGGMTPDEAAARIVAHFAEAVPGGNGDHNRAEHWNAYYKTAAAPRNASTFATRVADTLGPTRARLLEVGCGNGRDASFFAASGHDVVAIDASVGAIENCRQQHAGSGVAFHAGTLDALAPSLGEGFDVVYSRFCLHAMTRDEEAAFIGGARGMLRPGGRLFIECRSINDPLARKGEIISPTERIFGHYRRFIVRDELRASLEAARFAIEDEVEQSGLAVHGDDDPVVIRMTARRTGN